MKLKRNDLKAKVQINVTVIVWNDKQNLNILMNMHSPTVEGNLCGEHRKAVKLAIKQD